MTITVKDHLLTDRQIEIFRYRKQGMTQQQIAILLNTTRQNIYALETGANENIQRAKNTMDFYNTLNARLLCTVNEGSDLIDAVVNILEEANKTGVPVTAEPMDLANRLRADNPNSIKGRLIRREINVFLRDDGEVRFG